jgi:hypothetical protein
MVRCHPLYDYCKSFGWRWSSKSNGETKSGKPEGTRHYNNEKMKKMNKRER